VVRIHALEPEKTIAWVDAMTASRRIRPHPAARPAIINPPPDDEDLSSLVTAMILMHFYEDQYRQRFPGVSDARVQEHRLSLGYRMLQFAGLAQPALGDPSQYRVFVHVCRRNLWRLVHGPLLGTSIDTLLSIIRSLLTL
jgi:hypothetical protein